MYYFKIISIGIENKIIHLVFHEQHAHYFSCENQISIDK